MQMSVNRTLLGSDQKEKNMDTYRREIHGKILWKCGRSGIYVTVLSMIYAAACTILILIAFQVKWMYGIAFSLAALYLLLCIHRVHEPVVLVCEKALLIAAAGQAFALPFRYGIFQSWFIPLEYREIAGISSSWRRLYLGNRTDGGAVVLSVPLAHLSGADKEQLLEWIFRMQQS